MGSKYPSSALEIYETGIRHYPILTRDEELQLFLAYRNGDAEAGKEIITSNLRFVIKVSRSYFHFGYSPLEIIQEGNMGLVMALTYFDLNKGVRFISYAIWWIKAYIKNFIHKNYQPHTGRLSHARGLVSLDRRYIKDVKNDNSTVLDHMLDDSPNQEDYYGMKEQAIFFSNFLKSNPSLLTGREFFIIQQRFFSDPPATLRDIATKIGVTRERVRQIEEISLKRLRSAMERCYSTGMGKPACLP
jgi:RNA polymerase sigma factor (sigma-70 family)